MEKSQTCCKAGAESHGSISDSRVAYRKLTASGIFFSVLRISPGALIGFMGFVMKRLHSLPKSFIPAGKTFSFASLVGLVGLYILPTGLFAFFPFPGGGGGSGCTAGESDCPIELVLDGDKSDNDNPDKFYKFIVPATQSISIKLTDHDRRYGFWSPKYYKLSVRLHPLNNDGSCHTGTTLASIEDQERSFELSYAAQGGKSYCIETDGELGDRYDIEVDGTAALEAGISDASANENAGSMKFYIALTKAASSDTTIQYRFIDGSAINGTNYSGTNGSIVIPKGELAVELNVTLIDTEMTTTKTFSVELTSTTNGAISSLSGTATGTIYGSNSVDADDGYDGPDICYDSQPTSGFCMFGSCIFYQQTTHLRAMRDGLSNIDIKKALTRGIAFMNMFEGIGTDDPKTPSPGDDEAEVRDFFNSDDAAEMATGGLMNRAFFYHSMFPKGIQYRIGDGADKNHGGSMDKNDTAQYYDKALLKLGLFTQYTHIVTYVKNGKTYQEVLQACNPDDHGTLAHKPLLNECGIFLGALNSATNVHFASSAYQTVNDQETLNTPVLTGSTGLCSGSACQADGNGSNIMPLPEFMESQEHGTVLVPYGMVISEQHVGKLEITNDAYSEDTNETRHIVFEAPYSSSYGGRAMLIDSIHDHDSHNDTYHYVFKEGDYWIGSWDIDKSSNVTIETVGNVRFFIHDAATFKTSSGGKIRIGYRPDEDNTSTCDDPHFYMYLYDNWKLDAAGSQHIKNGYIYSKGSITLAGSGTMAAYYTAITADGELTISTTGSGTYTPGDGGVCRDTSASTLFDVCPAHTVTYYSGPFDAWDTFRDDTAAPPADRNISTKIAAKPFKLAVASLNLAQDAYETKAGLNSPIHVSIYDYATLQKISDNVYDFDANLSAHVSESTPFEINKAVKRAVAGFRFCSTYEANTTGSKIYTLYPDSSCGGTDYNCTQVTTGHVPRWHVCFSSDTFAVRPDRFVMDSISTDLIAGDDFNITLHAQDANGNDLADYNESVTILGASPTLEHNDTNPSCQPAGRILTKSAGQFQDGTATLTLNYNEVGKLRLALRENAADDFAHNDINDTDFSTSLHDSGNHDGGPIYREIGSTQQTFTFIPDHFQVDATLSNAHKTSSYAYTYLSSDLDMNATLHLVITKTAMPKTCPI